MLTLLVFGCSMHNEYMPLFVNAFVLCNMPPKSVNIDYGQDLFAIHYTQKKERWALNEHLIRFPNSLHLRVLFASKSVERARNFQIII